MRPDKKFARDHGIPPAQRRYCKRYGGDVDKMVQDQQKFPADRLDHWRDRAEAAGGSRLYPLGVYT